MVKILYILDRFPVVMESYVATELDVLVPDHDIKIAVFNIEVAQACPTRHQFELVRDEAHLDDMIQAFKPDILHGHFLEQFERVDDISRKHNIPYTLRSHAYDIAAERFVCKFEVWAERANESRCLGILVFPYGRARLERAGFHPEKLIDSGPVFNFERFLNTTARTPTNTMMALGSAWPKKNFNGLIDATPDISSVSIDLYALGSQLDELRQYNESMGTPITIQPCVENHEMPAVYRSYDWYIYTGNSAEGGMPVSVPEAWASGIGVLKQYARDEDYDFIGKAGFVFHALDEVGDIVSKPYPEEMRQAGFEQAKFWDFNRRRGELEDIWLAYTASNGDAARQQTSLSKAGGSSCSPRPKIWWQSILGKFGLRASCSVPAFVIVLKSDDSRCAHVNENIVPKLSDCVLVDATDASKDGIEGIIKQRKMRVVSGISRPKLACTISHLRVWEEIVASNLKHAVILEDDVVIEDGFATYMGKLTNHLPPDYDLVHLYIHPEFENGWSNLAASTDLPFVEFIPGWGRSAYMVSRSGAQKLLEQFKHVTNFGDIQIAEMAQKGELSVYCASETHVQNIGQLFAPYAGEKLRSTIHGR